MNASKLNEELKGIDLPLFDQILKGRILPGATILDAGAGGGRNSLWFLANGFDVHGIDHNDESMARLHNNLKLVDKDPGNFIFGKLEELPYSNDKFDFVICNAVLHFAQDLVHFHQMFNELVRVLQSNGILFIRMTSNIGIENKIAGKAPGVYLIPDGSYRFLLTRDLLSSLIDTYQLTFIEPVKTVNVADVRCMTTLVLGKL